jgi:hypothetical protein
MEIAFWTTFSRGDAIPYGRYSTLPGLGIQTLRVGRNLYLPSFNALDAFTKPFILIPSRVVAPSLPGVMLPGLDLISSYAVNFFS